MTAKLTTKQYLLTTGAQEFALKGYNKARIRVICDNAEANLASVNYHFGGKSNLYLAVFEDLYMRNKWKCAVDDIENADPEDCKEALRSYLTQIFSSNFVKTRAVNLLNTLIYREVIEPSDMFDEVFNRYIKNTLHTIERLICRITGLNEAEDKAKFILFSIVAQIEFYRNSCKLASAYSGKKEGCYLRENMEKIVDHMIATIYV